MTKLLRPTLTAIAVVLCTATLSAQSFYADKVVAVVGSSAILYSDVAEHAAELEQQRREINYTPDRSAESQALEELLLQKLLYNQAQIDSVNIDNRMGQISQYVDQTISDEIAKAGSLHKFEAEQHCTSFEAKERLKQKLVEFYTAQEMTSTVTKGVTITPGEVERFFRKMPKADIPIIPEQYIYAQITRYPSTSENAKQRTKERLLEIRERIINGARFDLMARMYSVDPNTAMKGGELPPFTKEQFVQPFVDAVQKLQPGQISGVVETEFGFHLIQLIRKDGDIYTARHILLKPIFSDDELQQTLEKLDSIAGVIREGKETFAEAALKESDDATSRLNKGIVTNIDMMKARNEYSSSLATTKFAKEDLDPTDYKVLAQLKIGEISAPFLSTDSHSNQWGKIITPVEIIPSHKADIRTDYITLEGLALEEKRQQAFDKWLDEKIKTMYIRIDPSADTSMFDRKEWIK